MTGRIPQGTVRTKVAIVGGGPAGLATALALQMKGIECLVIESRRPPIDKACGEGLMPDALHSLARLGITLTPDMGARFRGIRFLDEQSQVESTFPDGVGLGVRRTRLHQTLVSSVEKSGIKTYWGHTATFSPEGAVILQDRSGGSLEIKADWLVGADGQTSRVRRFANLDPVSKLETRYGFRRHYKIAPWTDFVEVHWANCGQIYITPVGAEEIGIALCTRDPYLRVDEALSQFPAVAKRLREAEIISKERGSITTTRQLRRVYNNSVALIGDASGSVDAVTGEGLAVAFRQALALAEAIESSNLRAYKAAHDEIRRLPALMAAMLLLLDRHPHLRKRTLAVLSHSPRSFYRLLSAHVGQEPLWRLAVSEGPLLGWRWLTT